MKKKATIFLTVIAVMVLIALAWNNRQNPVVLQPIPIGREEKNTPSPANATDGITIQYNDRGQFSPNPLEITQGKTVTFVNASKKLLWIASDPHPLHTTLPLLNSRDVLFANERYSYTFTLQGTWGYHNHLAPNERGTIIVKPEATNP